MKRTAMEPVFVEYLPRELDEGRLYISMEYATASHLCACGCGTRAVTPLGAADWRLLFDGRVTLTPSIGNGQFACGSHYLIRSDEVIWLGTMQRDVARSALNSDAHERERSYRPGRASRIGAGWIYRRLRCLRPGRHRRGD